MIVLIDNGHGSDTRGKCSPDGKFREYAYARQIAAMVVDTLKAQGVDARLLVPESADIPLTVRAARANALCDRYGAANVCLVSIHVNAAGSDGKWHQATGWEAWTSPGQTRGDSLAECLYDAAGSLLPPEFPSVPKSRLIRVDMADGDRDKEEKFTVLTKSKCPACLTENFFQDTLSDVQWLSSERGKQTIKKIHVLGILAYINAHAKK